MKSYIAVLLLLISFDSFSQEKVVISDLDKAFALIFSDPEQAKLDLDRLEIAAKKQNDSLYSIILNNKGIYFAVQTQMDSALIYFNKSIALVNGTTKRYVGTQTNIAIIYKKRGDLDMAISILEAKPLTYKNIALSK
jgi:tetratricopeptide (TPR) repeat protein